MRPNWFLALPVTAPWLSEVLDGCPRGVRRFHPDDLHLTVAFLGGIDEAAALRAWQLARHHPGPSGPATVDAVIPLGPPRRPSALSATLAEGHDRVLAFMAEHRDGWLACAGARPARRPPLPHCTLARPKRRASDAQRAAAVSWAGALPVAGRPLTVHPLALYTWSADRRERLFRVVARSG